MDEQQRRHIPTETDTSIVSAPVDEQHSGEPQDQYQLSAGELDGDAPQQVFILSLSGGGYRGLFSARLLARDPIRVDRRPADRRPVRPDCRHLGGWHHRHRAGAWRVGQHGFHGAQDPWPGHLSAAPVQDRAQVAGAVLYRTEPLRDAIHACLTPAQTASALADVPAPLLLTAVDWVSAELRLLGSAATLARDGLGLRVLDAMLATSAAPAHFAPHVAAGHTFVDGGLAANNPDLLALQAARQMWAGAAPRLLGIGTANPLGGGNPQAMPQRGFRWAAPVIELCMHAQERQAMPTALPRWAATTCDSTATLPTSRSPPRSSTPPRRPAPTS